MQLFSDQDRTRIAAAITEAESETSGEIVAVVTQESDSYLFIGLMWAALLALLVPLPLIFTTNWSVQHIYLTQLAVFVIVAALMQWRPLRLALVPRVVKRGRAHRHAMEQFLAQNLHTTRDRTGVLIFVSVAERFAEVIADEGIHTKAPPGAWDHIVTDLAAAIGHGRATDGFVAAVNACGVLLAEHFPQGAQDSNELPNHLIIL